MTGQSFPEDSSKFNKVILIEAAIDERGPRELLIVPSYNQYLVYEDEEMLACIQLNDDGEWEQVDGPFTKGVVGIIGREIERNKHIS